MEEFTTTSPLNSELFSPTPYCKTADRNQYLYKNELPSLQLIASNPAKLLHLCEKLTDESSKALEVKINTYLMREGDCSSTFLMWLLPLSEEAVVQVVGIKELETSMRFSVEDSVMKNLVLYDDRVLKCDDGSLDPQFLDVFKTIYPNHNHQIISVPILDYKNKCFPCTTENIRPVLLVCFVDSKSHESHLIKLAAELFKYCQRLLLNTIAGEEEIRQKRKYKSLITVSKKLFSRLEDINVLLKEITLEAKQLTNAQKCSLFLSNPDHVHFIKKFSRGDSFSDDNASVGLVKNQEIAEYVAKTGQVLNIRNTQNQKIFNKQIDEITGIQTKNLLCFPLRDENQIIGVCQLYNKKSGNFNSFDEELIKVYSFYCGLSIMHSLNYKYLVETQARIDVSNNMLIRYKKMSDDEIVKKVNCPLIHAYPQFDEFSFSPLVVPPRETVCLVLQMFEDLGFIDAFSVKKDIFMRFIMTVQESYRNIPFHNWMHALTATHFGYMCLKKIELLEKKYISKLEALAYFISCLCLNIDYRGANNPFQRNSHNTLNILYSSPGSIAERHHFSQTLCILNMPGCNFLEALNQKDYALFLDLLKDMILATDLASHLKFYKKQYNMMQEGYNKENPEHRYILASLLMTCAELAEHIKDWPDVKKVTERIYEEFFTLSNLEHSPEKEPIQLADKDLTNIPDMQIEFLKDICLPVFKMLGILFPSVQELIYKIKRNILCWETSKHIFQRASDEGRSCIDVLKSEELETNVEAAVKLLEKE